MTLSADDARDAVAFRRLLDHLRSRDDVANIEHMNMAGFCRNCLADWVREAGLAHGHDVDKDSAREYVYGMPYEAWKARQPAASAEQLARFAAKS